MKISPPSSARLAPILHHAIKLASFITVASFIAVSFYAIPSSDDFCHTGRLLRLGFYGFQEHFYSEMGGRYFSALALGAYPYIAHGFGADVFAAYPVLPLLVLLLMFCSFWALVRTTSTFLEIEVPTFWPAMILLSVYLAMMPSTAEGIYWWAATAIYTIPLACFLLLLAQMQRSVWVWTSGRLITKISWVVTTCMLVLLICGGSELLVGPVLVVLLIGVVATTAMGDPGKIPIAVVLVVAVSGAVISLTAPGNSVRGAEFALSDRLAPAVLHAILALFRDVGSWATDSVLLSVTFLAAVFLVPRLEPAARLSRMGPVRPLWLLVFGIASVGVVSVLLFLPVLGGGYLPKRAVNVAFAIFLLVWCSGMIMVLISFGTLRTKIAKTPDSIIIATQIIFMIGLVSHSNVTDIARDLLLVAGPQREQDIERRNLIKEEIDAGRRHLEVPELRNPATSIYFSDLTADPAAWQNQCYLEFYDIESIVTAVDAVR